MDLKVRRFLTSLVLFAALPVFGQNRSLVPAQFRAFDGGLNDTADPTGLAPNESPELYDVVVDDPGKVKPRNGYLSCGATPSGNPPTGLYEYFKGDGTRRLIVTDNSNVWETRDCVTYTTIKSGLSASAIPSFATVRNKLWVVNGATWTFTWDGTTSTLLDGRTSTPNPPPPIGRYIEFWHERVWIGRTSSYPSGIAFSALTDSSGNDLDPSTGTASWPATNVIQIDQDGGSPLFSIRAYRDRLFGLKDNGIWNVEFHNDFDISVVKTLASVGTRFHQSVVEADNLLWFVGKDGIYAFDGDQANRTSDKIRSLFSTVNQPLVNNQFKSWTSNSDFNGGVTKVHVDTGSTTGSLLLGTTIMVNSNFDDVPDGSIPINSTFSAGGSTWTAYDGNVVFNGGKMFVGAVSGDFSIATPVQLTSLSAGGVIGAKITANLNTADYAGCGNTIHMFVAAVNTGGRSSQNGYAVRIGNGGLYDIVRFDAGTANTLLDVSASHPTNGSNPQVELVISSSGVISLYTNGSLTGTVTDTTYSSSAEPLVYVAYCGAGNVYVDNVSYRLFYATSSWESDVYNAVSVSTWSTFDATSSNNGVSVNYSVRVGSDTGAVAQATYTAITPGTVITGNSNQIYIQVRAQSTANSSSINYARLDDITVNYSQGGFAGQTIYAAKHDNRLWISMSTGSATYNNLIIVRSKMPGISWVPYRINAGPMATYNDFFYAGCSSCSTVFRMDYGTNDNGAAINWLWTSRGETWGFPQNKKRLLEISTDFLKGTAANSKVGYSRDNGVTFSTGTVNMSGSGRGNDRRFFNGGSSYDYRLKWSGSTLDEMATLTGIIGWSVIEKGRD